MTKDDIRDRVRQRLLTTGVISFPGVQSAIPNFVGAERAAQLLCELPAWRRAKVVLLSTAPPQAILRRRALEQGKIVYLALPKLRGDRCFVEIEASGIGRHTHQVHSLIGAQRYGRLVHPSDVGPVDLLVCGSIAVTRQGARLGAGGGYDDIAYALLRSEGRVREYTPILTTIHSLQLVNERLPMRGHDIPVDFIVTPAQVIATPSLHPRPRGVIWDILREDRIAAIPVLRRGRQLLHGASLPRRR